MYKGFRPLELNIHFCDGTVSLALKYSKSCKEAGVDVTLRDKLQRSIIPRLRLLPALSLPHLQGSGNPWWGTPHHFSLSNSTYLFPLFL